MILKDILTKESAISFFAKVGIFPILLLMVVGFSLADSSFFTTRNIINIGVLASINIVIATGMTFVILTEGIDLSVGSILGLSAVVGVTASLSNNPTIAMMAPFLAIGVGMGCGALNGILISKYKMIPFIATLGAMTYLRGGAYLTAGGTTAINNNLSYAWIGNGLLFGYIPWLIIIALIVVVLGSFILNKTLLGNYIYAVGGNKEAARLCGIKVGGVLFFVYTFVGGLCGLAGVMLSSRLYSANGQLGTGYELDAIAAVILGGTSFVGGIGTVVGTVMGALVIAILNSGLTIMGISFFWQLVIKGGVIILAILIDNMRRKI